MLSDHFPPAGLRVSTPRLCLRLPTSAELAALAELAAAGIHEPGTMPFLRAWSDQPPGEVARSVIQHQWRLLGGVAPEGWTLPLAVFCEGTAVGLQGIGAEYFAVTREVTTGSWLGRAHQGRGIGTEMRAAVLHLAFAGLGAETAVSGAFTDNPASQAVSAKLGYEPDGTRRHAQQGRLRTEQMMRLSRQRWQRHRGPPVTVEGLQPCLELLGARPSAAQ